MILDQVEECMYMLDSCVQAAHWDRQRRTLGRAEIFKSHCQGELIFVINDFDVIRLDRGMSM